jgi:putative FmdB family regulatory protein
MPMYDYCCSACLHHEEHFYKMSSVPDEIACEQCGYPAPRTYDPELTLRKPRRALAFTPIVVHRRIAPDGSYAYSYPANPTDPPDPGYEPVTLSTLAQADRFVKDRDREEQELRTLHLNAEEAAWNDHARERRSAARQELENRLGKSHSKIGDIISRLMDERRSKRYQALRSKAVNFHIQALSYDANHCPEHREEGARKICVVVNRTRS